MTINSKTTLYSSDLLIANSQSFIPNGSVIVRDGLVIFCGKRQDAIDELKITNNNYSEEYYPAVMTPGLINAHTHLQYTGMADLGKQRFNGMQHWIKAFDKVYRPLSQEDESTWQNWALKGANMLIASGTTAAAEVVTDKEASRALNESGLHGIAYREILGIENENWYDGSEERILKSLSKLPANPGVGIGPHATYSMGSLPLRMISEIAKKHRLRTHIHVAEAPVEGELTPPFDIDSLGMYLKDSEYRNLRLSGDGRSAVRYLDDLGVLNEDCHIAHGIYVNEADREILRKRDTVVALCPRSNAVIGLDEPPIASYLMEGNVVALGTDSLSSSPSLNLLDDAELFIKIARRQGYSGDDLYVKLFEALTIGGAKAMGKTEGVGRLGVIEEGSSADFAYFDLNINANNNANKSVNIDGNRIDLLSELFESGAGHCVATIIAGEKKFEKA